MNMLIQVGHVFLETVVRPILSLFGFDLVRRVRDPLSFRYARFDKFRFVIESVEPNQRCTGKRIVWCFWWQGEEAAPEVVKVCLASIRRHMKDEKVVVLSRDNISSYVTVPAWIEKLHEENAMTHTHYSDYLRVKLLSVYGGIWIDATVFMTGDIPKDILNARFFVYRSPMWMSGGRVPSKLMVKLLNDIAHRQLNEGSDLSCSSWLMVAGAEAVMPRTICRLLEEYWKEPDVVFDYFIFHRFINYAVWNCSRCRTEFVKMPNYDNISPHLMQCVFDCDYNQSLYEEICCRTAVHKLTYKFKHVKDGSFLEKILNEEK